MIVYAINLNNLFTRDNKKCERVMALFVVTR